MVPRRPPQPGQPTRYDVAGEEDYKVVDWGRFCWVPQAIVMDDQLEAGDLAAFVALSTAAELELQKKWLWELTEDGERPWFGTHCSITVNDIDRWAGFTHSVQRNKHLDSLEAARHIHM